MVRSRIEKKDGSERWEPHNDDLNNCCTYTWKTLDIWDLSSLGIARMKVIVLLLTSWIEYLSMKLGWISTRI